MGNLRCVLCHKIGARGFFRFPKDSAKAWLKALNLDEGLDVKPLRICYRHFSECDLENFKKQIRVKPGKNPESTVNPKESVVRRTESEILCKFSVPRQSHQQSNFVSPQLLP